MPLFILVHSKAAYRADVAPYGAAVTVLTAYLLFSPSNASALTLLGALAGHLAFSITHLPAATRPFERNLPCFLSTVLHNC